MMSSAYLYNQLWEISLYGPVGILGDFQGQLLIQEIAVWDNVEGTL